MKYFSTRRLVHLSFLIGLSIVLTRVFSLRIVIAGVEGIRIGLGGLPIIFAGIAFGPWAGAVVGAIADLLGYLINPLGPYLPHFTLTSLLTGFIPGLIIALFYREKPGLLRLLVAISVGQIITSVIMVPVFLQHIFGIPLAVTLLPRIISQALTIPVYAYLCNALLKYDLFKLVCQAVKN